METPWPPPYTIRRHPRAKYLRLSFDKRQGLILTLPPYVSTKEGLQFIHSKRSWVEHQLQHQQASLTLPSSIYFLATEQHWTVEHINAPFKTRLIEKKHTDTICLAGSSSIDTCHQLLQRWLVQQAKITLTPKIEQLSTAHVLPFNKTQIRLQKTRWGSCSANGTISLNAKLLFLPPELVNYTLLHELSHTIHPHHQPSFWQLLTKLDPLAKIHDLQLRSANKHIPSWAM